MFKEFIDFVASVSMLGLGVICVECAISVLGWWKYCIHICSAVHQLWRMLHQGLCMDPLPACTITPNDVLPIVCTHKCKECLGLSSDHFQLFILWATEGGQHTWQIIVEIIYAGLSPGKHCFHESSAVIMCNANQKSVDTWWFNPLLSSSEINKCFSLYKHNHDSW